MKRILLVVTVALVMAAMAVVMAVPAFAAKGDGEPPDSSCGIGKEGAHNAIEKPKKGPGASEAGHISTTVCSGQ
jgi:hypothetical protein